MVEEYHDKVIVTVGGETFSELDELYHFKYKRYLGKIIQKLIKTPDFERLFCIPLKDERGKIKQYVWVNLVDSSYKNPHDSEIIEEALNLWQRHSQACINGVERVRKKIDLIMNTSVETLESMRNQMALSLEYESDVLELVGNGDYYIDRRGREPDDDTNINKIIAELKAAGKPPERYKIDPKKIMRLVKKELLHPQITHILTKVPTQSEIHNNIKEIIVTHYYNKKSLKALISG